jgi:hypothetical protein
MVTIENLLQRVQKVNIPYLVTLSLIDSSEEYIRLQQEQLSRGERADGKPIFNLKTGSTKYSPGYAKKKGKSSPIDLHDKGDFYGGLFIQVDEPKIARVDSTDWKSEMLQENYGEPILTLNDESKVKLVPICRDNLIKQVVNTIK